MGFEPKDLSVMDDAELESEYRRAYVYSNFIAALGSSLAALRNGLSIVALVYADQPGHHIFHAAVEQLIPPTDMRLGYVSSELPRVQNYMDLICDAAEKDFAVDMDMPVYEELAEKSHVMEFLNELARRAKEQGK